MCELVYADTWFDSFDIETGRRRRNKPGFVDDEQSRWKAACERKRMLLPSWKVDRWRFFTHLARRASICIKLIGSPYWLLLSRSKRDGILVAVRRGDYTDRKSAVERWLERRSTLFSPFHSTPFLGYARREQQTLCGKLLRYSSKIRIPYRGNSRQVK